MWLKTTAKYFEKSLSPVVPTIGNIGAAAIAIMMFLTVADIIGRRVFNTPIYGTYEISSLLMVIAVFFTIPLCEYLRGHIKIDILTAHLPKRTRNLLNAALYFLVLVTFGLITRQLYIYGLKMFKDNMTIGSISLPVYPFVFVGVLGCGLMCLVVIMHLIMFVVEEPAK
jgi:TRAP-type transport system small permease protein